MFDFDGTISLIREGWQEIMSALIVEVLSNTGTNETENDLCDMAGILIAETTGLQTVYQMIRLAEEVRKRGAKPEEPLDYKHEYNRRLLNHIENRRDSLKSGSIKPEEMAVPYAHDILRALVDRGVDIHLASGTDIVYVREEAQLLGIDIYFGNNINGALDDYRSFSKKIDIENIINKFNISGDTLVGFGDGFIDMETVKSVGGMAVAVASDETGKSGKVDNWKRERLIRAGADIVIPDFRDLPQLLSYLRL
jgi:phosphoglycolate phosphatase-like HAD superfamily hydrolase